MIKFCRFRLSEVLDYQLLGTLCRDTAQLGGIHHHIVHDRNNVTFFAVDGDDHGRKERFRLQAVIVIAIGLVSGRAGGEGVLALHAPFLVAQLINFTVSFPFFQQGVLDRSFDAGENQLAVQTFFVLDKAHRLEHIVTFHAPTPASRLLFRKSSAMPVAPSSDDEKRSR